MASPARADHCLVARSEVGRRRRERLAGGLGFEPRFSESESDVLPLDDPPFARVRAVFHVWVGRLVGRISANTRLSYAIASIALNLQESRLLI